MLPPKIAKPLIKGESGTKDFMLHRLSGFGLFWLNGWFLLGFLPRLMKAESPAQWHRDFSQDNWSRGALALWVSFGLYHGVSCLRLMIQDYIKPGGMNFLLQGCLRLFALSLGIWVWMALIMWPELES